MLYWRLYFPDNYIADEPAEECSIGHVGRLDAAVIAVCQDDRGARKPLAGEPLNVLGAGILAKDPEVYLRERGATPWMPIFYRKRSLSLEEVIEGQSPRTDLVVFGRGRKNMEEGIDCYLWAITKDGEIIDCPKWAIDLKAAEALVGVA